MNYYLFKSKLEKLVFWDNLGYLRKLEESIALSFTFLLGLSGPVSVSATLESKSQTWPRTVLSGSLRHGAATCQRH